MPVRAVSRVGFQPLDYPNATEILRSMPRVSFYAVCRLLAVIRASHFRGSVLIHCTTAQARQAARLTWLAPVAQGIEHRPPEAGAQVRILPGAQSVSPTQRLFCRASQSNHLPRGAQRVHISKCRRPSRVHCIGHDVEPITEDMAVGFGQSYVPWRGSLCPRCSATNAARLS